MAKVIVTIDPKDGTRKYEVEGVVGGACEDLTKVFMQNNEVLEHQYTSEACSDLPDFVHSQADGSGD